MSRHLLEVQDLGIAFETESGPVEVVRDVSLHVEAGEALVILGESGSGKSVTSSAIMDLLDRPPAVITSGRILFHGQDRLAMPPEAVRQMNGKKIAMIFQDPLAYLHPLYTIGHQITEAIRAHEPVGAREAWTQAVRLLERVGIPDAGRRANQYPHQFSGGQRQRVMIAMALVLKPELLIADEPTTALDVTIQAQILKLLRELCADLRMGLILITHDLAVAAHMGDRVAVMQKGRIVETGPTREVFADPKHPYTRQLLDAVPNHEGAVVAPSRHDEPLLRVIDLVKDYHVPGGIGRRQVIHAVTGVSFEIRKGETLAIVGESGSGKSTIAKLLMRLEEPTSGRATYRGADIFAMQGADLLKHRRRVQMVFQDPYSSLNPNMRIGSIIAEPWTVHADILPRAEWPRRMEELLGLVGLEPEHARRYPHQFSGGQRQRIAIARALACDPELIICDEAVSALDVSIQAQIIELLSELRDRLGLAYIFISHDLEVVRSFADRVLVMKSGAFVEEGEVEALFTAPTQPYTQALVTATPKPKWEELPASARQPA
ncbi:MAG TPA: ABC transporter ATP-binding protein [Geminicoccaceae bacterium]|nr:ABC transporter ATP-binding protein [Geminicoccaceae bacterium]